jgi:RNA polymerase sigma factor (sigma-70 family)
VTGTGVTDRPAVTPARSGRPLLPSRVVVDFDVTAALAAAADGDQQAWDSIVARYGGLVWSVARGFRLSDADAADVSQTTWLRLVEHLGDIRDGERLGAWLATTTRREALGLLRRNGRDLPTEDLDLLDAQEPVSGPEHEALRTERDALLWRAFSRLPASCQRLLRVLMADPQPSYAEASAALNMPVGSIGPTRARCLTGLRNLVGGT